MTRRRPRPREATVTFKILAMPVPHTIPARPDYFIVSIDRTPEALWRGARALGSVLKTPLPRMQTHRHTVEALCWRATRHPVWPPHCLGRLFFHRRGMTPDVVAHECLHAALRWAERHNRKRREPEERLAYVLGRFVQQVQDIAARMRRG